MEDLTGIGKIAESQLANQIYNEAGSPAVKELGKLATDVTKTLRLFTAPFQLAALAQDRFQVWLEQARSRVPLERQVQAPANIAGPALKAMLFMEEDNPLAKMFVNLLSQTIDKDKQGNVHPGFVRILEQISPDEALLLYIIQCRNMSGYNYILRDVFEAEKLGVPSMVAHTSFSQDGFIYPDKMRMYFEHLESLCLVNCVEGKYGEVKIPDDKPEWKSYSWYMLSFFGNQFVSVCVQDVPEQIRNRPDE